MAGGNGSCVGGWIPTSAADALSSAHLGISMVEMEKQFGGGGHQWNGYNTYAYYKCNGLVPCNGTNGFDGNFCSIPQDTTLPYDVQIGFADWFNHKVGRIIRKPHQLFPTTLEADVQHNGLYLDLTGWTTSQTVNVRFTKWENNSGHFLDIRLFGPQNASGGSTPFTGGYNFQGNSDIYNNNLGGTLWATFSENQSSATYYLKGGLYYMFRTHDHSRKVSGIYCGGEDQGGGAGIASHTRQHLSVHDNGACCGDLNTYGRTDFGAKIEITGWS